MCQVKRRRRGRLCIGRKDSNSFVSFAVQSPLSSVCWRECIGWRQQIEMEDDRQTELIDLLITARPLQSVGKGVVYWIYM